MELRQVSAQCCRHDHIDMRVHVGIQRCSDAWAYLGSDWGIEAYHYQVPNCYANLHLGSGQAKAQYLTCTYLPWLTVDRFLPCADVTLEKEKT